MARERKAVYKVQMIEGKCNIISDGSSITITDGMDEIKKYIIRNL